MDIDAPFSSPEARAALEELKEIIRAEVPSAKIDEHAFRLVGESRDSIDGEIHELFEALQRQLPPLPHRAAFGLVFALREIICGRIREIEEGAA
jgi:hypothetical protein